MLFTNEAPLCYHNEAQWLLVYAKQTREGKKETVNKKENKE